ncbi:MAG: tetratricopeptide repeat protein [Bacteroidota bacterium]
MRHILFIVLSVAFCNMAIAQVKVGEDQVKLQEKFIEAAREKILGNNDKAIEILQELYKDNRDNAAVAFELSKLYLVTESFAKAIEFAENASNNDPENLWYKINLAQVFELNGQAGLSADIMNDIIRLDPNNFEYYIKQATLYVKAEKVEEAINAYDKAEKVFGIQPELIQNKHRLYLSLDKKNKAEEELIRLTEAFPYEVDFRQYLASFYESNKQAGKAKSVYQKILELDPSNVRAKIALAGNKKTNSNEVDYLNSLVETFRDGNIPVDLKVGKLIPYVNKVADTKNPELADNVLSISQILEETHPNDAKAFAISGDLYYSTARWQEAEEKYLKTVDLNPNVFLVWDQLMKTQAYQFKFDQLLETSYNAMDYFPNQAICYYWNAWSAFKKGDLDDALYNLDQVSLMVGASNDLFYRSTALNSWINKEKGKIDEAKTLINKIGIYKGNDPLTQSVIAYVYADLDFNSGQSLSLVNKAIKTQPNVLIHKHHLGWINYLKKDYEAAQMNLNAIIDRYETVDGQILEQYGDVLFRLGDEAGALEFWNKAKKEGLNSKMLEKKIADKKLY